mgnify:CR=1 FL=1
MKKVICPGEALIDFVSTDVGKSLENTNGFVKKTTKTPKSELILARKYKADYERSHCYE